MNQFLEKLNHHEKSLLQRCAMPSWVLPMLATLTEKRFSDPDWLFEIKYDGERALTFYNNEQINIYSRNKHSLNKTYPDLVAGFKDFKLDESFVVDGEIVAFESEITSFSKLQQRLGIKEISLEEALKIPVYYYIFDIMYFDGYDLRALPLIERRLLLDKVIEGQDPIRKAPWVINDGMTLYNLACEKGGEGIIAKNIYASYQSKRSRDWLKFKCHKSQELIIIGYTAPKGTRSHFGALLVGYYMQDKLIYAGKVGTGFTAQILATLKEKMDRYISPVPIVDSLIYERDVITWLRPCLVGEFVFTEWTKDGKLRHPRYKGLREDKSPKDVIREEPQ